MLSGHHSRNGFLTVRGYAENAQRSLEGLEVVDMELPLEYVDKVGSVSGLRRDEEFHVFDDHLLDEQHRRFHNGS